MIHYVRFLSSQVVSRVNGHFFCHDNAVEIYYKGGKFARKIGYGRGRMDLKRASGGTENVRQRGFIIRILR